jgi:iron complex transport system ATP-binding protein
MISHDINIAAKFADEIILMHQGRIFDVGSPEKVITEDNLRTVYGVASSVIFDEGRPHVILKVALPMGEGDEPRSPAMAEARKAKAAGDTTGYTASLEKGEI